MIDRGELTEFARFIYDWSSIRKNLLDIHEDTLNQFYEICRAFTRRNTYVTLTGDHVTPNQGRWIVYATVPDEHLGTNLYRLWEQAWNMHGYTAPLLDIEPEKSVE